MLAKSTIDDPKFANIPGLIKTRDYPTTWLLKHSRWDDYSLFSSDQERNKDQSARYLSNDDYMEASDISELCITSEQATGAISTKKLLKAYN